MNRTTLSESYDPAVRMMLLEAMRTHRDNPERPRVAERFISSPPAEFRNLDRGGRTNHERQFTRAVYYQTWWVPVRDGADPDWSARLTWGHIEKHGSAWGRVVRVRLFVYGSRSHDAARRRGSWITESPGAGNRVVDQQGGN